jgi:hypothetical protein
VAYVNHPKALAAREGCRFPNILVTMMARQLELRWRASIPGFRNETSFSCIGMAELEGVILLLSAVHIGQRRMAGRLMSNEFEITWKGSSMS